MKNNAAMYGIVDLIIGSLITGLVMTARNVNSHHEPIAIAYPHSEMSMKDMTENLRYRSGKDFDQTFIEMMIPHHEGAVEMARLAQLKAEHRSIQKMADDLINSQTKEIEEMKTWYKEWGFGNPDSIH